jgi:GNAT superfamily N-acetyltransferase
MERNKTKKKEIARLVLEDLPEWFGLPEHTENYIKEAGDLPCFVAYAEEQPVGYLTLKQTATYTIEIHSMGVRKAHHRQGYGRALVQAAIQYATEQEYHLIQVKTVEMGRYDNYDKTNRFYLSMGFDVLEVFPTLWDPANPCQVMVRAIQEKSK